MVWMLHNLSIDCPHDWYLLCFQSFAVKQYYHKCFALNLFTVAHISVKQIARSEVVWLDDLYIYISLFLLRLQHTHTQHNYPKIIGQNFPN